MNTSIYANNATEILCSWQFVAKEFYSDVVLQEVNKLDAYAQTKLDPQFLLAQMKEKFGVRYLILTLGSFHLPIPPTLKLFFF
jgi:hypothetical protein